MKNREIIAVNKVLIWSSILAILVCIGWIVFQIFSNENDYALWIILLLLNANVLFSNINKKG